MTTVNKEYKTHFITMKFSEQDEHFMLESSFGNTAPRNMFLDGYVASERFEQYIKILMAAVEDYKRSLRSGQRDNPG